MFMNALGTIAISLLVGWLSQAHGESEANASSISTTTAESQRHVYWYIGAGIVPQPRHDSVIQDKIQAEKASGHAGEYAGKLMIPGLFYRYSSASLVGVQPTLYFEQYASDFRDNLSYSLRTYGINLSWLAFHSGVAGLGYLVRAAAGPVQMTEIVQTPTVTNKFRYTGAMFEAGFGYGFQFSAATRFLIELGAHYAEAGGHFHNGVDLHMGIFL